MRQWILAGLLVFISSVTLVACDKGENDDLAKAQACLDKITEDNYTEADACIESLDKYDSQQANILKCSGKFLAGGLTTSKIMDAYKELENSDAAASDNKEAIFISYLALTPSSKAKEAAVFCRKTEVEGYIYLADLAVLGSILADVGNFSSPPTQAEIDGALASCQATPEDCEPAVLAGAVESVAESYCSKPSAKDEDVCKDINAAVAASGGDDAVLTAALTCLLGGKEFNNGVCN